MTPEEYQRIKDAEKEHLRALKKLKKAVRDLERSKSIANAVTRVGSASDAVLDTHNELVDKLAMETAHYEARLEVALEAAGEKAEQARKAEELEKFNADLQKDRARDLVDRIRGEMGGPHAESDAPEAQARETVVSKPEASSAADPDDAPLPEKTIGKMGRAGRKTED